MIVLGLFGNTKKNDCDSQSTHGLEELPFVDRKLALWDESKPMDLLSAVDRERVSYLDIYIIYVPLFFLSKGNY